MAWNPYIFRETINVGAQIRIDLTGTTIIESAPDAMDYSWRFYTAGYTGPTGDDPVPYATEDYKWLTITGYLTVDLGPLGMEDTTGTWYTSGLGLGPSEGVGSGTFRLWSTIVPTKYPPIHLSGEYNGLMKQSEAFYYSWSKSVYVYDASGDYVEESSGDIAPNITGFYGNWDIVDDYYLNYVLSEPAFFPAIVSQTQAMVSYGIGEVYRYNRMRTNSPKILDGIVCGPNLRTDGSYRSIYDVGELSDQQEKQHYWPRHSIEKHPTDHDERLYRKYHISLNMNFSYLHNVHQDLYERYFHPSFNNSQRNAYLNKRFDSLKTMLEIAETLPKEYRIRMQPQVEVQDSQLSYLPMATSTAAVESDVSTSAMSTDGGTSEY
jgi:hypothetical protein